MPVVQLPAAMKLTLSEFLSRYAASGLGRGRRSPAEKGRDAAAAPVAAFADQHEGRQPNDVRELAQWMIRSRLLTRYQAQQLLASGPENLRLGPFVVRQPLSRPPFVGWFSAVAEDGSPALVLPRGAEEDAAVRRRFEAHAAVSSPHLLRVDPPLAIPAGTLYVSRLPSGTTAAEATPRGGFSTDRVAHMGRQLCEAIAMLHRHGLAAPIDDATRVWLAKTGEAILLRDPLSDPASGGESSAAPREGWFARPAVDGLYLAPERQLDGRRPDAASDLYALGCLLFHLRFGHPPFAGATRVALAEQHARQIPPALRSALATPESGEPLLRVIGHAMAKNRDARFTDAHQMGLALSAVESALAASGDRSRSTPPAPESHDPLQNQPSPQSAAAAEAAPATHPQLTADPRPVVPTTSAPDDAMRRPTLASHHAVPEDLASGAIASGIGSKRAAIVTSTTEAPELKASAAKPPALVRRRRKKSKAAPWILGGLGVVVIILLILLLVGPRGRGVAKRPGPQLTPPPPLVDQRQSEEGNAVATPPHPSTTTTARDGAAVQLGDDPGLLWAAPSSGAAPELSLLPPGAAMIVSLRPDRLASTAAGQHLVGALEPELPEALQMLQRRVGIPLGDIDRLALAIEGAGGGATRAAVAVWLADPVPTELLRDAWQAEEAQSAEGHTVFVGEDPDADVYYIPPSDRAEADRFAVGSAEQIARIAEVEGGPLPLPQNLAQLWRGIGADPDLAVLVHPNFLFADGRKMLQQYAPLALDPLRVLLIPDAAAIALRMDIEPQWYMELRLAPGGGTSPAALARDVRDAMAELPTAAEQFLLTTSPHPSWRALALRLPAMLRAVESATRSGVVDGNAVVNLYLPAEAAPNVLLGSWLALNARPPNSPSHTAAEDDANLASQHSQSSGPQSVDQLLDRSLSIRFDQESLESAVETILEQFNASLPDGSPQLEIILLGGDLQLAGITQNQQIRDFEHRDQPLRTVLDDLVRRANPDKTATDLSHDAQKLVWALGPHPDNPDSRVLLITTRDQAVSKYDLPPQFKPRG